MNVNQFDATVIITTYRQSELLKLQLMLLGEQKTNYQFEIIVCEDGSVTNSLKFVNDFSKKFPKFNITYLWQQNKGFRAGQARNMGLRNAKGKVAILLDGDMLPTISFIEEHIEFHKKNTNSFMSGGRKLIDDSALFNKTKNLEKLNVNNLIEILQSTAFTNTHENTYRKNWNSSDKPWMSFFSCNASFKPDSRTRYNENLIGWGIEDWDIALDMYRNGIKYFYSESTIAYHVDYKPVISNAFRINTHVGLVEFARNLFIFIDTHTSNEDTFKECAVALRNYSLKKNNQWEWAGDDNIQRSYEKALVFLRAWLEKERIYSKSIKYKHKEKKYSNTFVSIIDNIFDLENLIGSTRLDKFNTNNNELIVYMAINNPSLIKKVQITLNNIELFSKIIFNNNDSTSKSEIKKIMLNQSLGRQIEYIDL